MSSQAAHTEELRHALTALRWAVRGIDRAQQLLPATSSHTRRELRRILAHATAAQQATEQLIVELDTNISLAQPSAPDNE